MAYNQSYLSEECAEENIKIDQNNGNFSRAIISKLIGDCFEILKAENDFTKNISEWSLYNFLKVFSFKHSVDYLIVTEIHEKSISFIKEKIENSLSQIKIKEIFSATQNRKIRNEEIKSIINIVRMDVNKLSTIIKFVTHTSWSDEVALSIGDLYKDLIIKKEKLIEFNKELSTF